MNPETKVIIDELKKQELKWEQRLAELDAKWDRKFADSDEAREERIRALEKAAATPEEWQPGIEGSIDDIKLEVRKLNKHLERVVIDQAPVHPGGIFSLPESASARPPAGSNADGPAGHRDELFHREDGFGSISTLIHPPVKGAFPNPPATLPPQFPHRLPSYGSRSGFAAIGGHSQGKLPKLNFPVFEGDNPRHWISRVEDYFELCNVEPHLWIKVATMHFSPAAARWLPSVEKRLKSCSWDEFHTLLLNRFGKEQHELLVRQLLSIKQSDSVSDYIDRFATLVDQLAAYESDPDQVYLIVRFIDGLRDDIRAPILIQRPSSLDTAFVLARLQEEVAEPARRRDFKCQDFQYQSKLPVRPALPLPPPPSKQPKALVGHSEDRRYGDAARARSAEDHWQALRAYRRAKGLCQYCAEKWSKDHKCADTVQLHAMQEVLDLFQLEEDAQSMISAAQHQEDHLFLTLSSAAVSGIPAPRTLYLLGMLQGHMIRILVDSGSSHTFISEQLASQLVGIVPVQAPLSVKVANGQQLSCLHHIPDAVWSSNGLDFQSDMKLLPLSAYDVILGIDWLEQFSPMKVHWKQKWMTIPYENSTTTLYGLMPELPERAVIQVCAVDVCTQDEVQVSWPPAIQQLIEEFAVLFEVPTDLPPPRACDHAIPLVEGAHPVQVRPYRFAPALKDEIEKQIKEMLQNGLIQKSNSPFSSSVLLVKKKDNTWRFCVDYRHLNAITIKGKYPVPIIDEFLDELAHASWFTCLDLRSGFHQIRLKPGEEFKTAFQMHCGQFEFREAMNSTLAPYLRKFVLVFFDDILIYSSSFEDHIFYVRLVFELLTKENWKIKLSKCTFAQRQISYLGHIISEKGVGTDPSKIAAISQWPVPSSVKELRSFLGLAGYYRKFVRNFGVISKPLTELLKKNSVFVWTSVHEKSFAALKSALCQSPVLALPDFTKPFAIETDASGMGVGAVLTQQGHPLAFLSKALGPKSQGLSTYEKEYLAILLAIQQ
nr:uncharacterized protein LOC117834275 [Setaria viridis]